MRRDEFIGQLEDYLDEFDGDTPLPDGVRDAVRAALPRMRQVSAGRPLWKGLTMTSPLSGASRFVVAAAAVVVVAVVLGSVLLNQSRGPTVGGIQPPAASGARPSASSAPPAASSTLAPSASAGLTSLASGTLATCGRHSALVECLTPGTYTVGTDVTTAGVRLDVPAGWSQWGPGSGTDGILVGPDSDAPGGSGWGLLFVSADRFSVDPCDSSRGTVPAAQVATIDQIARVMSSWPGIKSTAPTAITVDGHPARLVELTSTKAFSSCPNAALMTTAYGTKLDAYPMIAAPSGRKAQYRIVDLGGGKVLIIRTTDYPQTSPFEESQGLKPDPKRHTADEVELRAIVDSIRINTAAQP
ncbi:MAG TPA: hypothetical protein VIK65_07055 [Candidatus Limnocylindrales bacterium]|jgi:hypothetical protein